MRVPSWWNLNVLSFFSSRDQQQANICAWHPCNQKCGWQTKLQRVLVLALFPSAHGSNSTHIATFGTPIIKKWLVGETSTCSLYSDRGSNNTHTSVLNTPVIKNVVGRRNFNVLSFFSSRDQQQANICAWHPCNQKCGWQTKLQRVLVLALFPSAHGSNSTHISTFGTPIIKKWLAGETSTCSLYSDRGINNICAWHLCYQKCGW